jgi:hypothetical protein
VILPARPTLRCMRADLVADWDDQAQGLRATRGQDPGVRLHELDHPLVRHVAGAFPGDLVDQVGVIRESISATQDPPFYKAKTGRWRGAVWVDPDTGQAWLCAAGWRYEAEPTKDFYGTFPDMVAADPEKYLPTQDDRDLLAFEVADREFAAWEFQATVAVIKAVGTVADDPLTIKLPALRSYQMPSLTVELVTMPHEDNDEAEEAHEVPAEVAVQLLIRDWSNQALLKRVQCVVCSAVAPNEDSWDVAPGQAPSVRLLATIDEARLLQLRIAARLDDVEDVAEDIGTMNAGSRSHWAPVSGLARAMVEGLAVRGLCGAWFVPRQDHAGMPVCEHCRDAFGQMPA